MTDVYVPNDFSRHLVFHEGNYVRVSERSIFRDCRRKWKYSFVDGIRPKTPPINQWFGTGIHVALEGYYKEGSEQTMMTAFEDWYAKADQRGSLEYGGLWHPLAQELFEHYTMGKEILRNYLKFCNTQLIPWKVLEVEKELEAPIFDTPNSPMLKGHVDLIVSIKDDIWIVDHKTSSKKPSANGLELDDQMTAYIYLYYVSTGIMPKGAIYNVILKNVPQAPQLLQNGYFSTNKSAKVTYDSFMEAIKEQNHKVVWYGEHLTYLQKKGYEDYFIRMGTTRNFNELESFENRLRREWEDINRVREDLERAFPSPSTFKCGYCKYSSLCKCEEEKGDVEALKNALYVVEAESEPVEE